MPVLVVPAEKGSACQHKDERIRFLTVEDSALVNALHRKAAVILQKFLREGFGLTVTEAMWKGAAVIAGNCGGIKHQIQDGVSGLLVSSVDEAARAIVRILKDDDDGLKQTISQAGRETVKKRFLMSRELEQLMDLAGAFETCFTVNQ